MSFSKQLFLNGRTYKKRWWHFDIPQQLGTVYIPFAGVGGDCCMVQPARVAKSEKKKPALMHCGERKLVRENDRKKAKEKRKEKDGTWSKATTVTWWLPLLSLPLLFSSSIVHCLYTHMCVYLFVFIAYFLVQKYLWTLHTAQPLEQTPQTKRAGRGTEKSGLSFTRKVNFIQENLNYIIKSPLG